jgi:hypothetical protein
MMTKHILPSGDGPLSPASVFNFQMREPDKAHPTASHARTYVLVVLEQNKSTRPWHLLESRVQLAVRRLGLRGRGMAAVRAGSLRSCSSLRTCRLIVVTDDEK